MLCFSRLLCRPTHVSAVASLHLSKGSRIVYTAPRCLSTLPDSDHGKPYVRPKHQTLSQTLLAPYSTEPEDQKRCELDAKKSSLVQRFKEAYAIYGKVVIVIHGITSCFWFGAAYLTAMSGLNLLELFEAAHFPEWMCHPLRIGGGAVNQWATALVLYKILAPFRYGLTILLTRYSVRYLRATGKAPAVTEHTRLRTLAKESAQLSRERFRMRLSKTRSRAKRTLSSKFRR